MLHLAPDAISAQEAAGFDRFPLAAFLVAIAFYAVFFLHRILAPALRLSPHMHDYPMAMVCISCSSLPTYVRCSMYGLGPYPTWLGLA